MLEIVSFTLGPAQTNAYLVADPETKEAAVIDPAWDGHLILAEAQKRGWRIAHLWYTHAHFDHIGGAAAIADALNPLPLVALHPNDHVLWRAGGGGALFGFDIDPGPEPTIDFTQGQILRLAAWNSKSASRRDTLRSLHLVRCCLKSASAVTLSSRALSVAPISLVAVGSSWRRALEHRFLRYPMRRVCYPATALRQQWGRRKRIIHL
jgi:hypothetical protein